MFHAILGIPHGWRTSSNIFERLYPDATEKSRCQQLLRLGNQQFHDPRGEIWTICLSVFFDNDFVNAVYMYIIMYICIWCVYICICTQNFNINLIYCIQFQLCSMCSFCVVKCRCIFNQYVAMRRWESLPGLRKQLNPEELDALAEQAPLTPGDE